MALVDPNISMGYRGVELANPLAQYGQLAQIQNAQNQNALAQYQLGAAQRAETRDVSRMNALAQAGSDESAIGNALLKAGDVAGYSAFMKSVEDRKTQRLTQQKTGGEILDAKLKQSRQFLDTIDPAAPDAPQRYLAWHEANHRDPVIGAALAERGVSAEQARQSIMSAISQGPQAFAQLLNQSKLGTEKFMELNKPTVTSQSLGGSVRVLQTPGLGGAATVVPGSTAALTATPGELLTNARGLESNAIAQGRLGIEQQREARVAAGQEAILPPKEIQKREAALPQATQAIKGFESKSDAFIKDLKALRDDPGLEQITGTIYGRTPSVSREGSRAQALYDKVTAKGGFQALQDMRDASKTGGALGNVSNQEGKQLTASFAAIDRRQNAADVKAAIDQAIADIEGSKTRMREAYDATYAYKAAAPAAPAARGTWSVER